MTGALVISNYGVGDDSFDCDVGSWNVTRAKRACYAGKHKVYGFEVADLIVATENIEADEAKIAAMVADPARLLASPPLIFAIENGQTWLIDGIHRLRALHRIGAPQIGGYVIEDADGAPYRMWFNGARVAPWFKAKEPRH